MERIVYRKTLDVHKNGIQFTLQGFETADNMARTIEISLMASGDTIDLPLEQLMAIMYVTTPNATEPSITECTIKDNTIICDVMPIVESGITEMQLKLIETRIEGANGVLATPKFAIEVSESGTDDEGATQTTTYTALEDALAKAKSVYDSRILRLEIDPDCMFRVIYADGTMYETDVLREALYKGEALLSQSFARGDSGVREGEETDNSLYYSNVSRSASIGSENSRVQSEKLLEEVRKHGVYTAFSLDFETGELKYISPLYSFKINKHTGGLDVMGEIYTPEDRACPIGSVYISSFNENPSNKFGGTWRLIDKEFSNSWMYLDEDGGTVRATSDFGTIDTFCAYRDTWHIRIKVTLKLTKGITGGDNFIKLNLSDLGCTENPHLDGIINHALIMSAQKNDYLLWGMSSNGEIEFIKTISETDFPVGSMVYLDIDLPVYQENMLDSACDKFYWERTS